MDHASRFVDCRDRSQPAVIAPTAQFAGDGSNLPDFAEVAFALVAGRCNPSPEWLKCLLLLRISAQSWVLCASQQI
jgi:hypothetical protein